MPRDWFQSQESTQGGGETPQATGVAHDISDWAFNSQTPTEQTETPVEETPTEETTNAETSDTETPEQETQVESEGEENQPTDEEIDAQIEKPETPAWIRENRVAAKSYNRIVSAIEPEEREIYEPLLPKAVGLLKAAYSGEDVTIETLGLPKTVARQLEEKTLIEKAIPFIAEKAGLTPEQFKLRLNPASVPEVKVSAELKTMVDAIEDENVSKELETLISLATRAKQLEVELEKVTSDHESGIKELSNRESERIKKSVDRDYGNWIDSTLSEIVGNDKPKIVAAHHTSIHNLLKQDPKMKPLIKQYWEAVRDDEDDEYKKFIAKQIRLRVKNTAEGYVTEAGLPIREGYKTKTPQTPTNTPSRRNGNAVNKPLVPQTKKGDVNPWELPDSPQTRAMKRAAVAKRAAQYRQTGR